MKKLNTGKNAGSWLFLLTVLLCPALAVAADSGSMLTVAGIRLEFILFAATLLGVALFHHYTMWVALTGLASILASKYLFLSDFSFVHHIVGGNGHEGEWRILLNLLGLLFGFAVLAKHFEESELPKILPKYLPDDWKGGFTLLVMIFVISAFLDNIAAAMIGGAIAFVVFRKRVHIGYLAAIVAASNAGGSGSVVGDTTTTLMWIDGVSPLNVIHAYIAASTALVLFGVIASLQQDKYQRIIKDAPVDVVVEWRKLGVVALILVCAIITNYALDFPALGVWIALLLGALFVKTPWNELKNATSGTIFLMGLVTCASLMPVDELPPASWVTTFFLGFISAVFDNIPLTKLCLEQGGYDWGILAYAVGFGGSMLWFGSSAGVALSNMYPEARSAVNWLRHGWHVAVSYVFGFFVLLALSGWAPHAPHKVMQENVVQQKVVTPSKA
ncbi:citrate transporter [Tolumonas osonensis]|uniref:Na+/H+ antiporter NhaD/arsenite permease-like protein n=1 Tax=Tolumonas osonensis TaxID=675874 RepID=A0A841GC81_9GAMM|nr:citrate transporter [Tolumonas osonensis]MBB6055559.1 Na+/H+ antiporter NhaD/arsenite permease-like protein [Tolumonas osonensis]